MPGITGTIRWRRRGGAAMVTALLSIGGCADGDGGGTDSGFEGRTSIYLLDGTFTLSPA